MPSLKLTGGLRNKQFKAARKAARMAAKGVTTTGKLASAAGFTGTGRKLQAGGRTARAATRGQPVKAAKHARTLNR